MLVTGYIWTQISWIFPYSPHTAVFCYSYLYIRTVLLYSGDHCILRVYCTSTPKVDRQQGVPENMLFQCNREYQKICYFSEKYLNRRTIYEHNNISISAKTISNWTWNSGITKMSFSIIVPLQLMKIIRILRQKIKI